MNAQAQAQWKAYYNDYLYQITEGIEAQLHTRRLMFEYRREAALERKLAAAERTIQAQAERIAELTEWDMDRSLS